MTRLLFALSVAIISVTPAFAQRSRQAAYPPAIEGSRVETYKKIDDVELKVYIFTPEGHGANDKAPAIVFFFGGGWRSGNPSQFQEHCKYLANRGMVAMTADYRVLSRHDTKAVKCVTDGKSAIRWIRENAERLGVDPQRIAAGGGSAGGHVAACTGTVSGFEEPDENTQISSVPDALVLFNPATVLAAVEAKTPQIERRRQELQERMGVEPEQLSPYHQIKPGVPPTIIFHGTGDTTVSFATAELFTEAMRQAGNECKLIGFADRPHGFFNYGRSEEDYAECIRQMDKFLVEQGFLDEKTDSE